MLKRNLLGIVVLFAVGISTPIVADEATLSINRSGDHLYHHLTWHINHKNLAESGRWTERDLAYQLADGGQFEVYVRPDHFPVSAPKCTDMIILRMPWTDNRYQDADIKIATKRALLAEFVALRDLGLDEPLRVVLELDPYIVEKSGTEFGLELTDCVVFFRHAAGAYIPSAEPLSQVNR